MKSEITSHEIIVEITSEVTLTYNSKLNSLTLKKGE